MLGFWLPVVSGIIAITAYKISRSTPETDVTESKVSAQQAEDIAEAQYELTKIINKVEDQSKAELVSQLGHRFQFKRRQVIENGYTIYDYLVLLPNTDDYEVDLALRYVKGHFDSARSSLNVKDYMFKNTNLRPVIRVGFKKSLMFK